MTPSVLSARLRAAAWFVAGLLLLVVLWEAYKAVGPESGGKILGWKLLARASLCLKWAE